MKIATKYAQQPETSIVFMNQGVNGIFNKKFPVNNRPDVTVIRKTGEVDLIEVMSKTDRFDKLEVRITPIMDSFSQELRGEKLILNISKILGE